MRREQRAQRTGCGGTGHRKRGVSLVFCFWAIICIACMSVSVCDADERATLGAYATARVIDTFLSGVDRESQSCVQDIVDFCTRNESVLWESVMKSFSEQSKTVHDRADEPRICVEFSYILYDVLERTFSLDDATTAVSLSLETVFDAQTDVTHTRIRVAWNGRPVLRIDPTYGQFDERYRRRIVITPYEQVESRFISMSQFLLNAIPDGAARAHALDVVRSNFIACLQMKRDMSCAERAAFRYVCAEKICSREIGTMVPDHVRDFFAKTRRAVWRAIQKSEPLNQRQRVAKRGEPAVWHTSMSIHEDTGDQMQAAREIEGYVNDCVNAYNFRQMSADARMYLRRAIRMQIENAWRHGYSKEDTALSYRVFVDGRDIVVELWDRGDAPLAKNPLIVPGKQYSFLAPPWSMQDVAPDDARGGNTGGGMGVVDFLLCCRDVAIEYWGHYGKPVTVSWEHTPNRFVAVGSRGRDTVTRITIPLRHERDAASVTSEKHMSSAA